LPQFLELQGPTAIAKQLEMAIAEQDITAKALAESQKIFESAFFDIPIGMALVSLDGRFTEANKAVTQILGYSRKEILATDFQSITHPDDLQTDLELIEELISGDRSHCQLEKRFFHKRGHAVPVEINASILRDTEDNPLLFIVHIQDLSEQKRINASLQAATKASEEANKAKSDFLAMMSHEIRTPMNAMIGMTELLSETQLNEHQRDFVEVIQTSGNTLLTVINDILNFSKIESNQFELEMGQLDLYECVEEVVALFSNQAESKGLALTSLIEPVNIPEAFIGDPTRLRQILANLVSNSIKFTEKGEVSIQVSAHPVSLDELKADPSLSPYEVEFSIKDTGIGIASDKISSLFKPFSQVDASITRQYGGTGLGLVISKTLVEMMGGDISVESVPGEGSTFHFSIRLKPYEKSESNGNIGDHAALNQKHLLIVDSNETNRRYLSLQARSWGLNVEVAESAEAAFVQLFRSEIFDAIVVSEPLFDMGSTQLASQIRNFPHYQAVPLILFQDQKKSLPNRLNLSNKIERLQKPARRSQFYNSLVKLLIDNVSPPSGEPSPEASLDTQYKSQKPLKILLTEDIALNQKVAIQMLATYGYEADIANNGKEAVAALQRESYDLVFMDVQMPEMDGLEATRQIRADETIQQPRIIAMTAHAMQDDRAVCLSAGMNGYISKPISKRDIAEALQQCPFLTHPPQSLLAASSAASSDTVENPLIAAAQAAPAQALSALPAAGNTLT
ncbi:MAG: response regulator, partial [Phormidesmis sp.]